jgi:hypothetical protein
MAGTVLRLGARVVFLMSVFDRLLEPGCTELPDCRCGQQMRITGSDALLDQSGAHIRIYRCPACHHEMRLTIWDAEPVG